MKYLLYDIFLHAFIISLTPYFFFKMLSAGKYREGVPERFGFVSGKKAAALSGARDPVIWVHAVSVGETRSVLPLLRRFKEGRPSAKVVFSTVTKTAQEVARAEGKGGLIDALIYLPLDLSWAVKRVMNAFSPDLFIVVEKEVWPNLYLTLHKNSVPIIVVNGTVSERSFRRFVRLKFFFSDIFGKIDYFCARTDEDLERAVKAGVRPERAEAVGNIKFDLSPGVDAADSLKKALGIGPEDRVIVAGSTHAGEEGVVLDAYRELLGEFKGLKLILAPRHPERFDEVESLIKKSGFNYSRRTRGGVGGKVILLDTVGELPTVYSLADVAFVGGSLVKGIGGHNLLEPASQGKPVLYGAHLDAYLGMAELLEEAGGGFRVRDGRDFLATARKLLLDGGLRASAGSRAREVVRKNRGALERTIEVIEGFLDRSGFGRGVE